MKEAFFGFIFDHKGLHKGLFMTGVGLIVASFAMQNFTLNTAYECCSIFAQHIKDNER